MSLELIKLIKAYAVMELTEDYVDVMKSNKGGIVTDRSRSCLCFFFSVPATTEISTESIVGGVIVYKSQWNRWVA